MVSCLISENGEIVIQRNRGSEFNLLLLNIGKKKKKTKESFANNITNHVMLNFSR